VSTHSHSVKCTTAKHYVFQAANGANLGNITALVSNSVLLVHLLQLLPCWPGTHLHVTCSEDIADTAKCTSCQFLVLYQINIMLLLHMKCTVGMCHQEDTGHHKQKSKQMLITYTLFTIKVASTHKYLHIYPAPFKFHFSTCS